MKRPRVAALIAGTIALGTASRVWPIGNAVWDKSLGDVAYAVMVAFIVVFVRPRARAPAIAAIAITLCFAIELFQLTGIPARAPRVLRIALGTTFAWHDMACYAIGGVVAATVIALSPRAASGSLPSK